MRAGETQPASNAERRAEWLLLAPVMIVSLGLNFIALGWGLPNGNATWAVDALRPMTPLAVVHHLLSGGWNSGWFFFKYPLGHPLLLAGIDAPYLIWLAVTGGLGSPAIDYPYGFTNPEQSLLVLGLVDRGVSALMTTAATLVWYWTCREAFCRRTAWLAAWFHATMFPVVYYAHTTNVDSAMVFWCVLALYGAARVYHRTADRTGLVILAGAAAMAVSTKESAMGLIVTLAVMLAVDHLRRRRPHPGEVGWLPAGTWEGLALALIIVTVMTGAFINPLGVWRRAHFLTDSLPPALRAQYAPRLSQVGSAAPKSLETEVAQFSEAVRLVAASIGWPLAIAAAISCVGHGWRRPAAFFVIAAAGYYVGSIRAFEMLRPRYLLPLSVLACGLAAFTFEWGARLMSGTVARRVLAVVTSGLVVYSFGRGVDASRLLHEDSRYAAEAWLRANTLPETAIEVYQQSASLPRFAPSARVVTIPFDNISIAEFMSRQPDLVVLSSTALSDVTAKCTNKVDADDDGDHAAGVVTWRGWTGDTITITYMRNRAFMDALENGCLGFELVASFETAPWIAEPTIPSLAPEIRIYQRQASVTTQATSERCRRLVAGAGSEAGDGSHES